jgi:hypothetical protein
VPKLSSRRGIIPISRQNRLVTPHADDAENSEVDRPETLSLAIAQLRLTS